jgi:hypothetical protein
MRLDFSACSKPSTRPEDLIRADADTDSDGHVRWEINLTFGGADPCPVRVLVQNVVFKQLEPHRDLPDPEIDGGVRSTDADGDGLITLGDFNVVRHQFNGQGTRADYLGDIAQPFDGLTTVVDVAWFRCQFNAH